MMIITALTAVFLCLQNSAKAELWDVSYSQPLTEQQICDTVEQKPLAGAQLQTNIDAQMASVEDNDTIRIVLEGGVYYTNGAGLELTKMQSEALEVVNLMGLGLSGTTNSGTLQAQ